MVFALSRKHATSTFASWRHPSTGLPWWCVNSFEWTAKWTIGNWCSSATRCCWKVRAIFRERTCLRPTIWQIQYSTVLMLEFFSTGRFIDGNDQDAVWNVIDQSLAQIPYDQKRSANKKRTSEARRSWASTTTDNPIIIASSSPTANRTYASSSAITIVSNRSRNSDVTVSFR